MAGTVIEKGEVADAALPVVELAAQMRLADGVTSDPAQAARLRSRLRAAIDDIERRTGMIVLSRTVTLAVQGQEARRLRLPVRPVTRGGVATVWREGVEVPLGQVTVEADGRSSTAILSAPVGSDEWVGVVVEAGHADWPAVPPSLAQAVLLVAEALDVGEGEVLSPMAATLLAPFRCVRIGGRAR